MENKMLAELERLEREAKETKAEATERIRKEIKQEIKEGERKACVKSYFKTLVGREMTEAEYLIYEESWEGFIETKEKETYNIKSFIKERGLKILEGFNEDINDGIHTNEQG